jgi:hypothetical protein
MFHKWPLEFLNLASWLDKGTCVTCYITFISGNMILAPHTHELRDVPRFRALSVLHKPLHYEGIRGIRCYAKKKIVLMPGCAVLVVVVPASPPPVRFLNF